MPTIEQTFPTPIFMYLLIYLFRFLSSSKSCQLRSTSSELQFILRRNPYLNPSLSTPIFRHGHQCQSRTFLVASFIFWWYEKDCMFRAIKDDKSSPALHDSTLQQKLLTLGRKNDLKASNAANATSAIKDITFGSLTL